MSRLYSARKKLMHAMSLDIDRPITRAVVVGCAISATRNYLKLHMSRTLKVQSCATLMPRRGSCGGVLPGCRLSKQYTRRSIQQPVRCLHFTRPAEMPPLHSLRFALASRLPSRTAPTLNPHSARCLAGAQLPAISCLGAFRPPALGVRGETVIPAAENLHNSGHCTSLIAPPRAAQNSVFPGK